MGGSSDSSSRGATDMKFKNVVVFAEFGRLLLLLQHETGIIMIDERLCTVHKWVGEGVGEVEPSSKLLSVG